MGPFVFFLGQSIGDDGPILANKLLPIISFKRQEIIGNNVIVIADVEYCQ
jgi:hypothetical protein